MLIKFCLNWHKKLNRIILNEWRYSPEYHANTARNWINMGKPYPCLIIIIIVAIYVKQSLYKIIILFWYMTVVMEQPSMNPYYRGCNNVIRHVFIPYMCCWLPLICSWQPDLCVWSLSYGGNPCRRQCVGRNLKVSLANLEKPSLICFAWVFSVSE